MSHTRGTYYDLGQIWLGINDKVIEGQFVYESDNTPIPHKQGVHYDTDIIREDKNTEHNKKANLHFIFWKY